MPANPDDFNSISGSTRALLGHEKQDGNLFNLLSLRAEDRKMLQGWLHKKRNYLDPSIQNEILTLFSNVIIREIVSKVKTVSNIFPFLLMEQKTLAELSKKLFAFAILMRTCFPRRIF